MGVGTSRGSIASAPADRSAEVEKLDQMPVLFQRTAMSLFIAAAVLLLLVVPIRKMMAKGRESA